MVNLAATVPFDVVQFPDGPDGDTFTGKSIVGPLDVILKDALTFLNNAVIEERVVKSNDRPEANHFFNVPHAALEEAVVRLRAAASNFTRLLLTAVSPTRRYRPSPARYLNEKWAIGVGVLLKTRCSPFPSAPRSTIRIVPVFLPRVLASDDRVAILKQ